MTAYSGGPISFEVTTTTDGDGKYFITGDTIHHFLWFHDKAGYRQFRVGIGTSMGSTGEQPTFTMIKPGPLTMSPAVQELASQGGNVPTFTLGNFDVNDPNDMADLEICETTTLKGSTATPSCNWVSYRSYEYDHTTHCTKCFTEAVYDYFLWNFGRDGVTELASRWNTDMSSLQSMKWEFRTKSYPENVVSATLNLVSGEYTWQKEREGTQSRSNFDTNVKVCSSSPTSPIE